MAVSNLRRTGPVDFSLAEHLSDLSTDRLLFKSITSNPVDVLCEDYPYTQTSYKGTIEYSEPSQYTPGREISLDFEYRDGSNLFILELNADVSSIDRIINTIADAFPQDFTVYRNLHASEDLLWRFLEEADSVIQIQVLDDGQEVPYQELDGIPTSDVIGNYAIERAEVGFVVDEHQIVVRYQQGDLQIESDWKNGREYILQLFEREVLADI